MSEPTGLRRRRPAEALASLWARLHRVLRIRGSVVAGPVRFTELSAEPLHRALSRHGGGSKEYVAEFSDGARMRIRCTPARVYADLAHDPRAELNESLRSIVEPGMRVLLLGAGTGRLGDDLGCLAGPSGGVVCLDADEESARFAQRRYPRPNTAFEAGDVKDLAGEVDGAFDAVVVVETTPRGEAEARTAAGELLRVTAPGSRLVLAVPAPGPGEPTTGPGHAGIRGAIELLEDQSDAPGPEAGARVEPPERIGGWLVIVATRTEREPEV